MLYATSHMGCLLQWTPCISGRWWWRWSEQEAERDLKWMHSKSVSLAVTEDVEWGKGWLKGDVCRGMVFGGSNGDRHRYKITCATVNLATLSYSTLPAMLAVPDVHHLCHVSAQLFNCSSLFAHLHHTLLKFWAMSAWLFLGDVGQHLDPHRPFSHQKHHFYATI